MNTFSLFVALTLSTSSAWAGDEKFECKSNVNPLGAEITLTLVKTTSGHELQLSKKLPDQSTASTKGTRPGYGKTTLATELKCSFLQADPKFFTCSSPKSTWTLISELTTRQMYSTSRCSTSEGPQLFTSNEITIYVTPALTREAIDMMDPDVFFSDYWGLFSGTRVRFHAEECKFEDKPLAASEAVAC